ncbi:SseB family protein [Hymenobacter lucidus]|uniref:SseB family protein n=1 Tax=Hymenobacter lucidus TaxID=2880930 RepID=A0ABS8AVV7_9BACT|nr:SseB family protein [Hymenobacter lucidus]MCB2409116.1 SseB family protein [Hymenobacter lucidus]
MNFLKKLFGREELPPQAPPKQQPDNIQFNQLLDVYSRQPSADSYQAVMQEILTGNSCLLLPSVNKGGAADGWQTLEAGSTLTLASVFTVDGLRVLGAFSDAKALLSWAGQETEYTALRTQDVLEFCEQQGIDRVVINSGRPNMFVLERSRENIRETVLEQPTEVLVGKPLHPLPPAVLHKLSANFRRIGIVAEAYQYAQQLNGEMSIVLGVVLLAASDEATAALHHAVNDSLQGESLTMPLDVMVLENEDWLATVRGIEESLFFQR